MLMRKRENVGKSRVAHCTTHSGGGDVSLVDGFSETVDCFPKTVQRVEKQVSNDFRLVDGLFEVVDDTTDPFTENGKQAKL